MSENTQLVLIGGKSATGKSASLMGLRDPERVAYMNCENNKRLPFPAKFTQANVTDPLQVQQTMEALTGNPKYDVIVVDTLTYLMDMYETQYVLNSTNSMKAWGEYAQFFKRLMQEGVAKSDKQIIFTAHTSDIYNEGDMVTETMVKVKGSLMNQGIESYFSTVIASSKKIISFDYPSLFVATTTENVRFKYTYWFNSVNDYNN